jgi:hypothetical protein
MYNKDEKKMPPTLVIKLVSNGLIFLLHVIR